MFGLPKTYKRAQREAENLLKPIEILPENDRLDAWGKVEQEIRHYEGIQTDALLNTARELGIEIPKKSEKPEWWWDDLDFELPKDSRSYLTDIGKTGVIALIRKAQKENIEWWVKILTGLIVALTGLAGTAIGIIAILKK